MDFFVQGKKINFVLKRGWLFKEKQQKLNIGEKKSHRMFVEKEYLKRNFNMWSSWLRLK